MNEIKIFWKSKYNLFIFVLIVVATGLWIKVRLAGTTDASSNYLFSLFLGLVPLFASFKGFIAARNWGGLSSVLGRSVGALSFGVMMWAIGEIIWSYYNLVLKVEMPYPSLADFGFVLGTGFWIVSALLLSQLAGVNLVLKKKPALWGLVATLAIVGTALSYYLLVVVARDGVVLTEGSGALKTFLDVYYPFADFISLTVVSIITVVAGKYIGGKLRLPIVITMLGLAVMYIGDVIFSYTTTVETFYNAAPGDFILLLGISLLSFALLAYSETVPKLSTVSGEV